MASYFAKYIFSQSNIQHRVTGAISSFMAFKYKICAFWFYIQKVHTCIAVYAEAAATAKVIAKGLVFLVDFILQGYAALHSQSNK